MFNGCSQLTSLDLSNFNITRVTNMARMFKGCSQITSLDLSNFDTSKVTRMHNMFYGCSNLTYINLKNFIENNSLDITDIFYGVPDNIIICLNENNSHILNEINKKKCYNIDCSYEMKINNYSNCYKNCNYYHYFNNDNTFCTFNFSCPKNYPYLIQDKNECVVSQNNEIIREIESSIIIFSNNSLKSTIIIDRYSEIIFIIQNLMNILNNETMKKTKNEEIEYYDELIQNIEIFFTSKDYNTTKLDKGKDEIYESKKMKITLTTSQNQKNNINNNMTTIDLGECETLLKNEYNFIS